jgi:integrase
MRLKDYNEKPGKRVWLAENEIQALLDAGRTDDREERAALLLAGRCGLRRQEIVDVTPSDIVDNQTGYVVRVWHGKGDKYREVPAPNELTTLVLGMGKEPDESLVQCAPTTIYDWVQRIGKKLWSQTGDEGWQYVGPHDLRRSWGVRLLESGVMPSVVMEWGGWEDWETFRNHYLAEFSPEALREERGKVEWLGGEASGQQSYAAVRMSSGGQHYQNR